MTVTALDLASCSLFAGFPPVMLDELAGLAKGREVPKGMSVFLAGATGEALCIVLTGKVEILAPKSAGEKLLWILGPGESFGELALLRPGARQVTARAAEATRLVEIRRQDFARSFVTKSDAALKLTLAVAHQLDLRTRAVADDLLGLL
jgi:CRP/FNR family transcriptional regulator, cyclic AMP receptor protein